MDGRLHLSQELKFSADGNVQPGLDSQEKIRKRRLFKKVQAFCEENVLRYLLGVFW